MCIKITAGIYIVRYQSFNCLDPNFCSTVTVTELSLWWMLHSDKNDLVIAGPPSQGSSSEIPHFGSILSPFNYRPIGISVHNDEVVHRLVMKKSAHIHWNGYAARIGVVGGRADWDGAIWLQWLQLALTVWMSVVIPGQKIEASTLEIIEEVPWCVAWRANKHFCHRDGGMTILSLYTIIYLYQHCINVLWTDDNLSAEVEVGISVLAYLFNDGQ